MKKIKILHLASLDGNVGDNANHNGMLELWRKFLAYDFEIRELEIREFHWKHRFFNEDFVAMCNMHDLIIIGGGNYFELWVESSRTGTTVDLPPKLLKEIKPPIFFNGLGCDPYKGFTKKNLEKFRDFLNFIINSDKYFLTVRNDGSKRNIKNLLGDFYADKVTEIPDGGFFVRTNYNSAPLELKKDAINLVINLAGDMIETRFAKTINYNEFLNEFARFLTLIFNSVQNVNFVFVPHIFKDLQIIHDVLLNINDEIRRRFVSVAPYLHGMGSEKRIFALYEHAQLTMGMRFHSNVCSIGLNTPSIALLTYRKVYDLCNGLDLEDRALWVNEKGFADQLLEKAIYSLENDNAIRAKYSGIKKGLINEAELVMRDLVLWCERWI